MVLLYVSLSPTLRASRFPPASAQHACGSHPSTSWLLNRFLLARRFLCLVRGGSWGLPGCPRKPLKPRRMAWGPPGAPGAPGPGPKKLNTHTFCGAFLSGRDLGSWRGRKEFQTIRGAATQGSWQQLVGPSVEGVWLLPRPGPKTFWRLSQNAGQDLRVSMIFVGCPSFPGVG